MRDASFAFADFVICPMLKYNNNFLLRVAKNVILCYNNTKMISDTRSKDEMMINEYLECGKIVNTHGVVGEVKVESYCDNHYRNLIEDIGR